MPKNLSKIPSNKGAIEREPPLCETKWTKKKLSNFNKYSKIALKTPSALAIYHKIPLLDS